MDFFRKVVQVVLSKYSGLCIELVTSIFLVRALGTESYGLYTVLYLIPLVVVSFGSFGIGPSILYYFDLEGYSLRKLYTTSISFALFLGVLYYFLFSYGGAYFLNKWFFEGRMMLDYIQISMLYVPILLVQKYTRAILRASYKTLQFTLIIDFFPSIVRLLCVLGIVMFLNSAFKWFVWVPIIVQLSITLMVLMVLFPYVLRDKQKGFFLDGKQCVDVLMFGLKSSVGGMIQKANTEIVQLISVPFLSPEWIGFYALATKMLNLIKGISAAIQTVLVPKLGKVSDADNLVMVPMLSRCVVLLFSMITLCAALGFFFLIPIFYGDSFAPVVPLLWILFPGVVALSVVEIINVYFSQSGYPLVKSVIRGAGLALSICFIGVFVPIWCGNGLAALVTLSNFCMLAMGLYLMKKRSSVLPSDMLFIKKRDISMLRNKFVR